MNGYTPRQIAQALRAQSVQAGGGSISRPVAQQAIPVNNYGGSGSAPSMDKDQMQALMDTGNQIKADYFTDNSGSDGIAQAAAAQQYGPEVAKMGGQFAPNQAATTNGGFSAMGADMMGSAKKYGAQGMGYMKGWFQ